ncbi:MAG TPA: hypothetical protein VEP66_05155 [Myxococcales bacterium]|nr:hypothetical protein [Myxococcales bacterium]
MLAWKFFAPGGVAPFTAVRWPAPDEWIEGGNAAMALGGQPGHDEERTAQAAWFRERLKPVALR